MKINKFYLVIVALILTIVAYYSWMWHDGVLSFKILALFLCTTYILGVMFMIGLWLNLIKFKKYSTGEDNPSYNE